ncbi:MAG: hypothetical protein ACI4AL_09155 [Aristaeellaceae bacterium]
MRNGLDAHGMRLRNWLQRMRRACTREGLREMARRWARFLLNPRLLLCLAIAWMITNGWSYVMFGLGMLMKIHWMRVVGGAYMSFLWLPFTPEKLVTVVLAIGLMRLLYPRDRRTLGVLRRKLKQISRRPEC